MDAGAFDMFHDARQIDVFSIGDAIDFQLLADDVLVDQNRSVMGNFLNRVATCISRVHRHRERFP